MAVIIQHSASLHQSRFKIGGKLQLQLYLNRRLSIFKAVILSSRVEGDKASFTAAPDGPETRPLLSASAASIISRALCGLASPLKATEVATRDAGRDVSLESHNSSTKKTSPELRITDLSITFCNSRMFPGQS
jgi:hypothetical protein